MVLAVILTAIGLFSQTVFLPLNLAVLSLFLWQTTVADRYWPLVAFVLGLFFDLLTAQPLGLSSILFLSFTFFIWLYSHKWQVGNPLFLLLTVAAADWLSHFVWGLDNSLFENLLLGLLAATWGWWRQRSQEPVKVKVRSV